MTFLGNIADFYSFLKVDTIMPVLFDRNMNLVDQDEEFPPFLDIMEKFAENFLITKHFPFLIHLAMAIPMSIAQKLLPGYAQFRHVSKSSDDPRLEVALHIA